MTTLEKQHSAVDAELAKLPENQEKVLRLRYLEGLSWERVSKKSHYWIVNSKSDGFYKVRALLNSAGDK